MEETTLKLAKDIKVLRWEKENHLAIIETQLAIRELEGALQEENRKLRKEANWFFLVSIAILGMVLFMPEIANLINS